MAARAGSASRCSEINQTKPNKEKKMKMVFRNDFHNTIATARAPMVAPSTYRLNPWQAKRIRRALCGVKGCTCGGDLGERGMGYIHTVKHDDGTVDFVFV